MSVKVGVCGCPIWVGGWGGHVSKSGSLMELDNSTLYYITVEYISRSISNPKTSNRNK